MGVRKFKAVATEILGELCRMAGERKAAAASRADVRHGGSQEPVEADAQFWVRWEELAREISARRSDDFSAVDAVREIRREL